MNNDQLIKRIEALEKWKEQRERQQITLPLDPTSVEIINNYFMRLTGFYTTVGGAGGRTFVNFIGKQNLLGEYSPAIFSIGGANVFEYTANSSTDLGTLLDGVTIVDGQRFSITTSDTVPAPLDTSDSFVAINANDDSIFAFSYDGINIINLTNNGTGKQYLNFM